MNLPFVKGKENKRDLQLFLNVLFKREPMIHRRVEVERESADMVKLITKDGPCHSGTQKPKALIEDYKPKLHRTKSSITNILRQVYGCTDILSKLGSEDFVEIKVLQEPPEEVTPMFEAGNYSNQKPNGG